MSKTDTELAMAVALARSRAAWSFAAVAVSAALLVAATGRAVDLLPGLEPLALLLLAGLVVVPLTAGAPEPAWRMAEPRSRAALWAPVAVSIAYAGVVPVAATMAARAPLVGQLVVLGQAVLPLATALLAGARWPELGFGRAYRALPTAALLIGPLLAAGAALQAAGVIAFGAVTGGAITYLLYGAIPEEVHLRGVLMTRLDGQVGTGWAMVISSLLFGLSHVTANVGYWGGPPWPVAAALGVVFEGTLGLGLAAVFLRTRSLPAAIALHAALDGLNFAVLPHVQRLFH